MRLEQKTMIEAVVDAGQKPRSTGPWHFKYQPTNGGPIVSKQILSYGSDWVRLALDDGQGGSFFVHERQMAWAIVDWDCENLPPYTGQSLSTNKTLS